MNPDRYLSRIGLKLEAIRDEDVETVRRLQRAHIESVPFENLSIVGDPLGEYSGDSVSLVLSDIYEKVVKRRRGGLCFELNGLFGWLLSELGFDVDRVSGRVFSASNRELGPLESHLTLLVSLDQRYVVDIGFGDIIRQPIPLDGSPQSVVDGAWRVVESDRSDADYEVQFKPPTDDHWRSRYVFRDTSRGMAFFERACEYHQSAPEAPFTDDPVISMATERGRKTLSSDTLTWTENREKRKRSVTPDEWHDVLSTEFSIHLYRD